MNVNSEPTTTSVNELFQRAREQNVLNSVLLELTYRCNLDCTFCYNDLQLQGKRLDLEDYERLLNELAAMQVMTLSLSGGEPLMYPDFFRVGAHARKLGFLVTVKTNAIPLNERNADRLKREVDPFSVQVSLHGASAATHDRQTQVPGSFDRLLHNIRVARAHELRISLNVPLTVWNEGEIQDMYRLADELGVSLFFDAEITPRDNGDLSPLALAPSEEGIERMFRASLDRVDRDRPSQRLPLLAKSSKSHAEAADRQSMKICGAGSTALAVDPFGNVYPCVQLRHPVGNIHVDSIEAIWNRSPSLQRVRLDALAATKIAARHGMDRYCMGIATLVNGDPLSPPASALEISRIHQRTVWNDHHEK